MDSYASEWDRYVHFASRSGTEVPGRDCPWDPEVLWAYMRLRSRTCKPATITSHLSKLAHAGTLHGFVLPTTKDDCAPLLHRQIGLMKRQLVLDGKHGGGSQVYDPVRSTPLGTAAVGGLFAAFGVTDESSFAAQSRATRHHLNCCVMQHSCGMRFGHFVQRRYTVRDVVVNPGDGSMRLMTDWGRYAKRRSFCLEFAARPHHACQVYTLRSAAGRVVSQVAAMSVMAWHIRGIRRDVGDLLFEPYPGLKARSAERHRWLQAALLAALPLGDVVARGMVSSVTPHSFRSGLASDMRRSGAPPLEIARECRWTSLRAMHLYAERLSLWLHRQRVGIVSIPADLQERLERYASGSGPLPAACSA